MIWDQEIKHEAKFLCKGLNNMVCILGYNLSTQSQFFPLKPDGKYQTTECNTHTTHTHHSCTHNSDIILLILLLLLGALTSLLVFSGSVPECPQPEHQATRVIPSFLFWGISKLAVVVLLVAQSCPTLCNPMYYSPPGSSVHGILQERIVEWVAMPFSRGSSLPMNQTRAGKFFTV